MIKGNVQNRRGLQIVADKIEIAANVVYKAKRNYISELMLNMIQKNSLSVKRYFIKISWQSNVILYRVKSNKKIHYQHNITQKLIQI